MFDNIEDAEGLNSDCAFCHLPKFVVVGVHKANGPTAYDLERCSDEGCATHCKWNHTLDLVEDLFDEDNVAIASGWHLK